MKTGKSPFNTIRLLENIALGSAIFTVVICVLIIVNFIQTKRADPLNTPAMTVLLEKLQENPEDKEISQEIRTLDLLARKAFFTAQWQVRTGGYLLLLSILVLVSSVKAVELLRVKLPDAPYGKPALFWVTRILRRRWLVYSGAGLVLLTLLLGWLTHNDLRKELGSALNQHLSTGIPHPASGNPDLASRIIDPASSNPNPASGSIQSEKLNNYPSWEEVRSNFPSFRGPGGIGITDRTGIPTSWDGNSGKNIKWKTSIPLPGYNSPVIWNDKVFLSGASETKREVYCLDAISGKMLWKTLVEKIPGSPSQAPGVSKETGQAAPSLTTDGQRVYAIFANGDLIAMDLEGKKVWAKNLGLPANHYGHASSLIMYRDILIIQYDQRGAPAVMGLSGKTGEQVWKTARNVKISWASPSLINTGKRIELILSAEPCVASYDPLTGKELWKLDCISGEVGPSLAYANGIVFSVNEYSQLSAIQAGPMPKILWENNELLSDVPSPVASGNFLFLVTSYGTGVCYEASTGTKFWEHDFGNPVYSSPMLAEEKIYLMDKKGVMSIFKTGKEFSLIGSCSLGEGSVCTPAFTNGHIYLRGDKNLYCIGN